MDIKIAFFDFDWTLFDHRIREVNKTTIDSILKLKQKGVKIILNTARNYYSLIYSNYDTILPFDGFVTNNGGTCIIDNKVIYSVAFKKEESDKIIEFLKENKISYSINVFDKMYGLVFDDKPVDEFFDVFDEPYFLDMDEYDNKGEIGRVYLYCYEDFDSKIKEKFPNYDYHRFFETAAEITLRPFSKKEGIEAVLKYFNLTKENAISFGDDTGDIDMFNATGLSVCVGNGKEEAKKAATFVTDDIAEDGIKKALKHYNLI